jgi:hypothetical protein
VRRAVVAKGQLALVDGLKSSFLKDQRWPEAAVGRIDGEVADLAAELDRIVDPNSAGEDRGCGDGFARSAIDYEPSPGRTSGVATIDPVKALSVRQIGQIALKDLEKLRLIGVEVDWSDL